MCFSMCMGNFAASMATVDLRLALHRRPTNGTHKRLLHSIHRDKSLHYIWYRDCCILHACHCDDYSLLADMEGDQETTERSSLFTSWKTGC